MSLSLTLIQLAIVEILDGTFTGVRDVPSATYQVGSPDSAATHTLSLSLPTYEINVVGMERHAASPMSTGAAHSLETINVDVVLTYPLPSVAQSDNRLAIQATMFQDANIAVQALTFQGNLSTTSAGGAGAGAATGIISGMLFGPGGSGYPSVDYDRDWDTQIATATIHASVVVQVTQPTS